MEKRSMDGHSQGYPPSQKVPGFCISQKEKATSSLSLLPPSLEFSAHSLFFGSTRWHGLNPLDPHHLSVKDMLPWLHCCSGSLPFYWFASVSITKLFFFLSLPLSQSHRMHCGPLKNSDCGISTIYQTAHRTDNQIQPPGKHVFISFSHIQHS